MCPVGNIIENVTTKNDKKFTLTLLHSERPKLYGVLAILSSIGLLNRHKTFDESMQKFSFVCIPFGHAELKKKTTMHHGHYVSLKLL